MPGRERALWRDHWSLGAGPDLPSSLCLERPRRIIGHPVSQESHSVADGSLGWPRRRDDPAVTLDLPARFAVYFALAGQYADATSQVRRGATRARLLAIRLASEARIP